ncbi:hypothetical protein [Streptomyces sp. NBC_01264]|uniref:hypothetical protein n=1 Tax=Streptomyces sp. NBC_01264 TaxID=2903804 RepID=UPI002250F01B|nr:hypothetical protein [Streptomyces sp. NBC_01264]MCX4781804.1 hypothetical protein [Streptomyces sp. NBC_01264]
MDKRSPLDAADHAEFSLIWFDHARREGDCAEMRRALLSMAQCMRDMSDPATAAALQALADLHGNHTATAPGEPRRVPWQGRGRQDGPQAN